MKKVILFSAIALAAAVSCTKSEVVDTKFNEQIGFETYLGRDAMTKGTVETAKTIAKAGVFGYYLGATKSYDAAKSEANLWNPLTLVVNEEGVAQQPKDGDVRYWTNESDYYTFLAYAPKDKVTVPGNGVNPTIEYTVPSTLSEQVDVLCAEPQINRQKGDGTVALVFGHKLARLTVKAKATAGNFDFHVQSIELKGKFNTAGKLPLANPTEWTNLTATENTVYSFPTVATDALPKPATAGETVEYKDYAGTDSYLMMIPVNAADHAATLKVVYNTSYMVGEKKMESADYTKEFEIKTDFVMGKAYAINLEFQQALDNEIKFSVSVDEWGNEGEVTATEKTQESEDETPGTQE